MARISKIKRGVVEGDERLKSYSALLGELVVLDNYRLIKETDASVKLTACISIFKKDFSAKDEFGLIQPLGNWLCSLPKGIWDDKEIKKNHGTN
jgi:hypothetical protein